jgi:hypothetical protein
VNREIATAQSVGGWFGAADSRPVSDEPMEASVVGGLGRWLDGVPPGHYCGCVVIQLDTLRALYEHGYRLSVFCRPCGRHVCLDIPILLAAGHGERAVVGLPVRCHRCGRRGELSILWDPLRGGQPLSQ